MSRVPKNRDSTRDVWRPNMDDGDRDRGRDRSCRSVSRERRRSPPPPPRRRPAGDRDSYRSPVRAIREFDRPGPSSRRRSRGRSRSIDSRRSARHDSLSPRRPSRNETGHGRHGDSPEPRRSGSHRHKHRHPSVSPPKRRRSRSPGHASSMKHSSRKSRRPRSPSKSRSPVRRTGRRDISISPRLRSPSPKKYSHKLSSNARLHSVSRSPPRRTASSRRLQSPPPRTRRPSPRRPHSRRRSPPPPSRRQSPPGISSRYSTPPSRRHSPPPPARTRIRASPRRRTRSRSPYRGPTPQPTRRVRSPQRSPPHSSNKSSVHRSPEPQPRNLSPTPPRFEKSQRLEPVNRSVVSASNSPADKSEVNTIPEEKSPNNMETPPRRISSILDQPVLENVQAHDPVDGPVQDIVPPIDSYGRPQEVKDSSIRFQVPPQQDPRYGSSGPYVNPERQRNINGNGPGGYGRGQGWSQDQSFQGQPLQSTHGSYPNQHGQYRQNSYSHNRHGTQHGLYYNQNPQYSGPPHQAPYQPYTQPNAGGFRSSQFSPVENRQQLFDRRGSSHNYPIQGPPHQGRGRGYNNGGIGRGMGRGRFNEQPPLHQLHESQPPNSDDNPFRPGAKFRVKDELEDDRKDSESDEMSLANSSQESILQEPKLQDMPPPSTRPASKEGPPAQPPASGPFKKLSHGQSTVRNGPSQEEKGSSFRPFSINISKSKIGPKPGLVPKALGSSREFNKSSASGSNNLPLGKTVEALRSSAKKDNTSSNGRNDSSRQTSETPPAAPQTPSQPKPPVPAKDMSIYNRLSMVGEGTYGKVYKASNNITKELVALKRIRMESEKDGFPVTAVREMKLLQALKQENIVSLLEMMVEKSDFYMVFEYMDHDLTGILGHPTFRLEPCNIKSLAKQLFEGLHYLHHRGVLHRDIKGSNILLNNEGQLKIADFGLARFYKKADGTSKKQLDYTNRVITLWYRPPEICLGATAYGPAVDMWSAACVFIELFTRQPVFTGKSDIDQLDYIYDIMGTPSERVWAGLKQMPWYNLLRTPGRKRSKFKDKFEDKMPPSAFELISQLLQYDPGMRPSAEDCLNHRYFSEEPAPAPPLGLRDLVGEWHEYESKMVRRKGERKRREKWEADKKKRKEEEFKAKQQAAAQQEYDPERPITAESISSSITASKRRREEDIVEGVHIAKRREK